jgi:positive regulator of sigma E activity
MSRAQRAALALATLLAAVSGATYALFRYVLERGEPPFVEIHPLEPLALEIHVLAVPLLVFAVGWIFQEHVVQKLTDGEQRRASGAVLLLLVLVLAASGYGRTVADEERTRVVLAWTHGLSGALWVLLLVIHVALARRTAAAADLASPPPVAGGEDRRPTP